METQYGDPRLFNMFVNWFVNQLSNLINWFMSLNLAGVSVGVLVIIGMFYRMISYFVGKRKEQ